MSESPELPAFEVCGELPIVDAVTGVSVSKPGVVRLDPAKTIIAPLVEHGLIKALPPKQSAKAKD